MNQPTNNDFQKSKKMQMIKYKQLNLFTLTFSKNEKMKI